MKFLRKNWAFILIAAVSLLLGVLALLTAIQLRQEKPIAPTVPTPQRALEGTPVAACRLTFSLAQLVSPGPSASPAVGTIGDFVWRDTDKDGIQDTGETGIPNVTVTIYNAVNNGLLATTTTNSSGIYQFTGVLAGSYYIRFTAPQGYTITTINQGSDDAKDSDANATTGNTATFTLTAGQSDSTRDAGMYQPTASPSPTPTASPSPTPTASPSPTPTATPGTGGPASCNNTCGSEITCAAGLSCYNGTCRNPSCTAQTNCTCPTPTATPTPTPTTTPVPQCNNSCTSSSQCPTDMTCYITSGQTTGVCRNPNCSNDTDCTCTVGTATPTPSASPSIIPTVPQAGTIWPTVLLVIGGMVLLIVGFAL